MGYKIVSIHKFNPVSKESLNFYSIFSYVQQQAIFSIARHIQWKTMPLELPKKVSNDVTTVTLTERDNGIDSEHYTMKFGPNEEYTICFTYCYGDGSYTIYHVEFDYGNEACKDLIDAK